MDNRDYGARHLSEMQSTIERSRGMARPTTLGIRSDNMAAALKADMNAMSLNDRDDYNETKQVDLRSFQHHAFESALPIRLGTIAPIRNLRDQFQSQFQPQSQTPNVETEYSIQLREAAARNAREQNHRKVTQWLDATDFETMPPPFSIGAIDYDTPRQFQAGEKRQWDTKIESHSDIDDHKLGNENRYNIPGFQRIDPWPRPEPPQSHPPGPYFPIPLPTTASVAAAYLDAAVRHNKGKASESARRRRRGLG